VISVNGVSEGAFDLVDFHRTMTSMFEASGLRVSRLGSRTSPTIAKSRFRLSSLGDGI
jgi:hypothetical protein